MTGTLYPWLEQPWQTLIKGLAADRMPHALLIGGPRGIGKRALALALAARLLCANDDACGNCPACKWHAAGNHPDWHTLHPEEDKKTISVDGVRELINKLTLSSLGGGRKVALVEPADVMTRAAANSLLKTLEEPPGDTVLLLLASQPALLSATILSRCQQLQLEAPDSAMAADWLNQQAPGVDWLALLAFVDGAPLAALALHKDGFDKKIDALHADLAALIGRRQEATAVAARWIKIGPDLCIDWLARVVSELIRWRFGVDNGDLAHKLDFQGLPDALGQIKLNRLFDYLDDLRLGRSRLATSLNTQMLMETLLTPWALAFTSNNELDAK